MPKAYIADSSKFRTAVLKEYCRSQSIEPLCMQDAARLLEELRSVQPDVVFLRDALLRERPGLIQELRAEAPLDKAVVVVVAGEGSRERETAGTGADFWLSSSAALTQLAAVFERVRKNIPRALIVSSYVRQNSQFCQALTAHGFELLLAATGERGLEEALAHAPEIILVEGKLVDMPGADFCRRARELEALKGAAIFVLLAKPDSAMEKACRDASAHDVFSPPFHAPPNIEKVRKSVRFSLDALAAGVPASLTPPAQASSETLSSGHPVKVLLVDDQPTIGEAVRRMLAQERDIAFHFCSDPTQAIKMAVEIGPTVILQDLVMPQIDGLVLTTEFRANPATRDIPLVVLSTMEEPCVKAEAFARGANDYLVKLPDKVELVARLRYHSRGYLNLLQRNEAYRALSESRDALAAELAAAAGYVRSLLPAPLAGPEISTAWIFLPSAQLGGDALGYHWLDADHLVIYLLDVCGHGVGAALLSVTVMNVLRSQSLPKTDFRSPEQVLGALNVAFPLERHKGMFFSIWYGVFNRATRELRYSRGGHPPAILLPAREERSTVMLTFPDTSEEEPRKGECPFLPRKLMTGGMVVGCRRDISYASETLRVEPKSKLYIFSDGVYEVKRPGGKLWTLDNFIELLAQPSQPEVPDVDRILAGVRQVQQKDLFDDDFSLLQLTF